MYALKRDGFALDELWQMTPRQMRAWLFIAGKSRDQDRRESLAIYTMAARGDPKFIQKALKDDPE